MIDRKHRQRFLVVALDQIWGGKSILRQGRRDLGAETQTDSDHKPLRRLELMPAIDCFSVASALRRSAFSQAEPPNRHFKGEMRTKH
jgi:hypothetical protein